MSNDLMLNNYLKIQASLSICSQITVNSKSNEANAEIIKTPKWIEWESSGKSINITIFEEGNKIYEKTLCKESHKTDTIKKKWEESSENFIREKII